MNEHSPCHLTIKPISLADANAYVQANHRHHDKVAGHKFSIAAYDGEKICGVAIIGRPVSRYLDNGTTLEILRLCTDGTRNACSLLYGRAARIAGLMGYEKIITYILQSENGASLKASNFVLVDDNCCGGTWSRPSRPRTLEQDTLFGTTVKYSTEKKKRWERRLNCYE